MPYKIAIRKNETGEVRIRDIEWAWEREDTTDLFWWTDGNMSCDCNRFLEFERAGGNEPDHDDCVCGETAYSVLYAELPDGTRVPVDDDV